MRFRMHIHADRIVQCNCNRARLIVAVLCLTSFACVPATEDPPPRGAVGFSIEPSSESRGAAWKTDDGYTLRVEKILLSVTVSRVFNAGIDSNSYGSADHVLYNAAKPTEILMRALPVGMIRANCTFESLSYYDLKEGSRSLELRSIAETDLARLRPKAPRFESSDNSTYTAPFAGYLSMTAEKDGRRWTLETLLFSSYEEPDEKAESFTVTKDALDSRKREFHVEELFRDATPNAAGSRPAAFAPFIRADSNNDNVISEQELQSTPATKGEVQRSTPKAQEVAPSEQSRPHPFTKTSGLLSLRLVSALRTP
jgi:hypothetical protein